MKTWDVYKEHVKSVDPIASKDLDESEALSAIVSAMIQQRNALGISQRELATLCGIPQSSVARIESFKTTPKLDTLLKIFKQLNLQLAVISPVINR
ncbi:MAG: helix-turn-helix domain-containing protein [Dorea sp.]|nr:helix-turn-helix domain-containing protein [Dorea sp.]